MTLKNCLLLSSLFLISCSEQQARKPITVSNSSSLTSTSTILKKINSSLSGQVVTKSSLLKNYCPAEEYHQRYLEKR